MTPFQLDESAKAPWTRTTVCLAVLLMISSSLRGRRCPIRVDRGIGFMHIQYVIYCVLDVGWSSFGRPRGVARDRREDVRVPIPADGPTVDRMLLRDDVYERLLDAIV